MPNSSLIGRVLSGSDYMSTQTPQLMLHCTSTVLKASHHWSSIVMRTGACHGGENGHASLRLSCQWRGSLHRRRNGHIHTQPTGVGESLLSSLPTAAPHVRS